MGIDTRENVWEIIHFDADGEEVSTEFGPQGRAPSGLRKAWDSPHNRKGGRKLAAVELHYDDGTSTEYRLLPEDD